MTFYPDLDFLKITLKREINTNQEEVENLLHWRLNLEFSYSCRTYNLKCKIWSFKLLKKSLFRVIFRHGCKWSLKLGIYNSSPILSKTVFLHIYLTKSILISHMLMKKFLKHLSSVFHEPNFPKTIQLLTIWGFLFVLSFIFLKCWLLEE